MGGKHTIDYEENEVPKAFRKNSEKKPKKKGLKIFLAVILIIIIILATICGGAYWYINDKLNKMQTVNIKISIDKSLYPICLHILDIINISTALKMDIEKEARKT